MPETLTPDGQSVAAERSSGAAKAVAAILFMGAATMTMDVASALNSSPWTAESFGGDKDKAASCREYVYWSLGFAGVFCVVSAVVSHAIWPIVGFLIAAGFMYWIYDRALKRAVNNNSKGW